VHHLRHSELLEVAGTGRLAPLLPCLQEDGEEEPRQDGDDRDDHQQLDQRETPSLGIHGLQSSGAARHSRTVQSKLPLTSVFPSREKARDMTQSSCPLSAATSRRVARFQSRTTSALLFVARVFPSEEKASQKTMPPCVR